MSSKKERIGQTQVCLPTMPSAVIRGSNEFEDFGVTDVSNFQCQNMSHLFHFPIGIFFFFFFFPFFLFWSYSVKVSHCVAVQCDTFMNLRLVTHVTLVTNIYVMCHWLSNV
jgi:hypothetical protein